jgi:hypothetical protein
MATKHGRDDQILERPLGMRLVADRNKFGYRHYFRDI